MTQKLQQGSEVLGDKVVILTGKSQGIAQLQLALLLRQ
jgi:hypothetical protein